ncbi:NADH-quinone oxidoreductase subunit D, partial [Francisella tularensis subsp. holarctica]|nr:NADH-quinone oxidoreductase subunit D [Francisella tularensis subsp. holarctica]
DHFHVDFDKSLDEIDTLLNDNRLWKQRTVDIGTVTAERAKELGFKGPMLRGSGVAGDLRKNQTYEVYHNLEFDITIGANG